MAWTKLTARLVYSSDRQAELAKRNVTKVAAHGLIATNMKVDRVYVSPGDIVTPESRLLSVIGTIKSKSLREVAGRELTAGKQATRGSSIDPRTVSLQSQVNFAYNPTKEGCVVDVLVKPGDALVAGTIMMTLGDAFKKTFKLETLNAEVYGAAALAQQARREVQAQHGLVLHPPMFKLHVTVVRGQERVPQAHQALWGKHENEIIEVEVDSTPKVKYGFWYLDVRSSKIDELRHELGLGSEFHAPHLTIGREAKEKAA